jgi:YfiH family protein
MGTIDATPRTVGPLPVVPLDIVLPLGVTAFLTTRAGGVSQPPYDALNVAEHVGDAPRDVELNRRLVADAIDVPLTHLLSTEQVHGSHVTEIFDHGRGAVGDALVTKRDDVALMIMAADCLPLLVVDTSTTYIGVIHAGWRGLQSGVIRATLDYLDSSTTHVVLGPCISQAGYQVGDEVADHFRDIEGAVSADTMVGKWRLDLRDVALHQLREAGVPASHLHCVDASTDGGALFFSDRAARPCGRFALVARRSTYHYSVKGRQ